MAAMQAAIPFPLDTPQILYAGAMINGKEQSFPRKPITVMLHVENLQFNLNALTRVDCQTDMGGFLLIGLWEKPSGGDFLFAYALGVVTGDEPSYWVGPVKAPGQMDSPQSIQ